MSEQNPQVKYPEIEAELVGGDGNAFAIIGGVSKAIKRQGVSSGTFETQEEAYAAAAEYSKEAMESESYDALLQHAMRTVNVS